MRLGSLGPTELAWITAGLSEPCRTEEMPSLHTSSGIRDPLTTTSTHRFDETTTHTSLTALVDGCIGEGK